MTAPPRITVCICTFCRPDMLERLLRDVSRQETEGEFTFSTVVADNDPARSAEAVVKHCAAEAGASIHYCHEPRRNIALARNKTLQESGGDAIVFIDDDEFPAPGWLLNLVRAWRKYEVAGVLGPVRPHFPEGAPGWIRRGGFYDRPEHQTGFVMPWAECRTGNVLLSRNIFPSGQPVFNPEFPVGGEDVDFFRRMTEAGRKFVWCNEAVAYETVPPQRWKRGALLRRALQRGANSHRQPAGRWRNVAKAVVAVPLYGLALPVLLLAGHHYFMRYLVKCCDHAGRLLACVGIVFSNERQM